MKRYLLGFAWLAACAGAVDDPSQLDDGTSEGDIGQVEEALNVPFGYGFRSGTTGDSCVYPGSSSDYCLIATDKIVKPHWSGPTTSALCPGVDFKLAMQNAITKLQGHNFTVQEGSSTSNEKVSIGTGDASTAIARTGPGSLGSVSCDLVQCTRKFNSCTTTIYADSMAFWGLCSTASSGQFYAETHLEHEIAHCMGLPHSTVAAGTPGSFMRAIVPSNANQTLNSDQHGALTAYQP